MPAVAGDGRGHGPMRVLRRGAGSRRSAKAASVAHPRDPEAPHRHRWLIPDRNPIRGRAQTKTVREAASPTPGQPKSKPPPFAHPPVRRPPPAREARPRSRSRRSAARTWSGGAASHRTRHRPELRSGSPRPITQRPRPSWREATTDAPATPPGTTALVMVVPPNRRPQWRRSARPARPRPGRGVRDPRDGQPRARGASQRRGTKRVPGAARRESLSASRAATSSGSFRPSSRSACRSRASSCSSNRSDDLTAKLDVGGIGAKQRPQRDDTSSSTRSNSVMSRRPIPAGARVARTGTDRVRRSSPNRTTPVLIARSGMGRPPALAEPEPAARPTALATRRRTARRGATRHSPPLRR